jgi:hypothetical protein
VKELLARAAVTAGGEVAVRRFACFVVGGE